MTVIFPRKTIATMSLNIFFRAQLKSLGGLTLAVAAAANSADSEDSAHAP